MLINLEGVDLCGKTTLLDKFKLLFKDVIVINRDKIKLPRRDSLAAREIIWKYYLEELDKVQKILTENPNQIVILDRFFLSELVYGKVIRGYDSSDMLEEIREVQQKLREISLQFGFGIIYLSDSTEGIRSRFQKVGDDYIKDKKYFHNLKGEYDKQLKRFDEFKQIKINVFKDVDYWNRIIEEILLNGFNYTRHD